MMNTEGLVTVEQRIAALESEIAFQIEDPQGGDLRIAACNEALREIFVPDSRLYKICMGAFENRPDLNHVHANRLIVRSFQRPALRYAHSIDFPRRYFEAKPWADLQELVLGNANLRRRFTRDMHENDVQTNHDERGKSLKLLPLLMPERFSHPLRILELGSGPNHILKKLALNAYGTGFDFQPIKVKRPKTGEPFGTVDTVDDPEMSEKLSTLLAVGRLAVKKFIGIDKDSIKKPSSIEWIRSQFYTSEYLDPEFLEKFDLVQLSRPANVHFQQVNIFDLERQPDLLERLRRHGPFDFVLYGTFLYQLTQEGRDIAERVGNKLIDPDNGIKVYQDAIDIDPEDANRLTLFQHWSPYTWRTIIEDMRNPGKKQVLFAWRNGRCSEVQIGPAELCLDNVLVSAEQLLAA